MTRVGSKRHRKKSWLHYSIQLKCTVQIYYKNKPQNPIYKEFVDGYFQDYLRHCILTFKNLASYI
jgi:hypothetical protein